MGTLNRGETAGGEVMKSTNYKAPVFDYLDYIRVTLNIKDRETKRFFLRVNELAKTSRR